MLIKIVVPLVLAGVVALGTLGGTSEPAAPASAAAQFAPDEPTDLAVVPLTRQLGAPTDVQVDPAGWASWTVQSPAPRYELQTSSERDFAAPTTMRTATSDTRAQLTDLDSDRRYFVRVRAITAEGESLSPFSAAATFAPAEKSKPRPSTTPAPPANPYIPAPPRPAPPTVDQDAIQRRLDERLESALEKRDTEHQREQDRRDRERPVDGVRIDRVDGDSAFVTWNPVRAAHHYTVTYTSSNAPADRFPWPSPTPTLPAVIAPQGCTPAPASPPEPVVPSPTDVTGSNSLRLTGLTSETDYTVTVTAVDGAGKQAAQPSNPTPFKTSKPTIKGLAAGTAEGTKVPFSWQPIATAAKYKFEVVRADDKEASTIKAHEVPAGCTSVLFEKANTKYLVRATGLAKDGSRVSEPSPPVEVTTGIWPLRGVRTSDVTTTTAQVTWDAVPGAAKYVADVATDPAFQNVIGSKAVEAGATTTVGGLARGTRYYVRVTAKDADGQDYSTASPAAAFETLNITKPSEVFDLSRWKLTLPIGDPTEIFWPALNTYTDPRFFHLDSTSSGVVFRAEAGGSSTSKSKYPRSELREMVPGGGDEAGWPSSPGRHSMKIVQAITSQPSGGGVVAGQIHDAHDDYLRILLEGNQLKAAFTDLCGCRDDGKHRDVAPQLIDGNYQLGTRFTLEIVTEGNVTTVFYNGAPKAQRQGSFGGGYFKAGAYTQSDKKGAGAGEVVIYQLTVTHQ